MDMCLNEKCVDDVKKVLIFLFYNLILLGGVGTSGLIKDFMIDTNSTLVGVDDFV